MAEKPRILIHNLGTSDLSPSAETIGPMLRQELAAITSEQIVREAAGDGARTIIVTTGDPEDPDPRAFGFPRLEAYLRHANPTHVLLNLTRQGGGEEPEDRELQNTEWMERLARAWLECAAGIGPANIHFKTYDVSECFTRGRTMYPELQERLQEYRARYPDAEWFVTLTGGLPQMSTPLALLAAEMLSPVTLLCASRPRRPSDPTLVHSSHLLSILKLAQITHLVDEYDYAGALALLTSQPGLIPNAELRNAALAILEYGAARLDHRAGEALKFTGATPFLSELADENLRAAADEDAQQRHQVSIGETEETTWKEVLKAWEAEGRKPPRPAKPSEKNISTSSAARLGEQIYIIEILHRRREGRNFVAQLHVFTNWLLISYADQRSKCSMGSCGDYKTDFSAYGALRSAGEDLYSRLKNHDGGDTWFDKGNRGLLQANWRYTSKVDGLAWLCGCIARQLNEDMESEFRCLAAMTTPNAARHSAVHNLLAVADYRPLLHAYGQEKGEDVPGDPDMGTHAQDAHLLGLLLRNSYSGVFGRCVPPLVGEATGGTASPYTRLAGTWRKLVDQIVKGA